MKTLLITASFLLLLSLNCIGQIEATTKDGKDVLLFDNGTWKYALHSKIPEASHNLCESLFERIENPNNGDISIILTNDIIVFNGIEGFSIGITKSPETVHVILKVVSTTNCIDDNAKINVTFQDDSSFSITSDTKSNCDALVEIDFLGIHGKEEEFQLLSTKEVKSIKIWTKDGYVEQELTNSQSENLLNSFSCVNTVGVIL